MVEMVEIKVPYKGPIPDKLNKVKLKHHYDDRLPKRYKRGNCDICYNNKDKCRALRVIRGVIYCGEFVEKIEGIVKNKQW